MSASQQPPAITSVSPTGGGGGGGTSVTITGSNLTGASAVSFGGSPAGSYTVVSATEITATSPPGSGTVDVVVTTPGGSATSVGAFTFYGPPAITSVSPTGGSDSGGTPVTITGSNLNGASAVTFGGSEALSYTVVSATEIAATSPAGSGTVDVVVTTPGGIATNFGAFTYYPPPAITSVSPTGGGGGGGTSVTITGSNLSDASAVTFGGNAALSPTVVSATEITAISPPGSGTVDVVVTTPGGSATSVGAFTYYGPPAITSVSPTGGSDSGGTPVTISGSNLSGASAVTFGGNAALSYTVVSPTEITATSPPGSGTVDVVVTTPGGIASETSAFTYIPSPAITAVNPTGGVGAGGTSVTITGTNLTGASAVTFGGSAALSYTVVSATEIAATSPPGSGTVDVVVTTPGGSATETSGYTYIPAPTIASVSPTSGGVAGGTPVTITGTNLSGASAVSFGPSAAPSYTVVSPTEITATSPAGTGTVDVVVTTTGGIATDSGAFTYVPAPTITGIGPPSGRRGTAVTITGTNLGGASAVSFGLSAALSFTVVSSTEITAAAPAGTGTVSVSVKTPGETASDFGAFRYLSVPGYTPPPPPDTGCSSVAMAMIGSGGGTVTLANVIALDIPGGAFSQSVSVTLCAEEPGKAPPPAGYTEGAVFSIGSSGIEPTRQANATFACNPATLNGLSPARLGVYCYDAKTGDWTWVGGLVNAEAHTITVTLQHFSTYGIMLNPTTFSDLTGFSWARPSIDTLLGAGVIEGVSSGAFDPGSSITRADFTTMLVRAAGLAPIASGVTPFKDVPVTLAAAPYIAAALRAGLVTGVSASSFDPGGFITREQMAVMFARLPLASAKRGSLAQFTDAASIAGWAETGVEMAVGSGLMSGFSNHTFEPLGLTTRAEAAVVIARYLMHLGKV